MSYLEKLFKGVNVEWRPLSKALIRTKGTSITAGQMKDLHKGDAPLKIFAGGKTVAFVDFDDIPEKDINREPSIIVKSRGVIEFEFYDKPFSHKNEMWSYHSKNENINIKFVYYFLKINEPYFQNIGNRMQMPQISTPDTESFLIPIPSPESPRRSLEIQTEIVRILDTYTEFITELTIELTTELAARKKQHNYYLEQLLSFEKGEVQWKSLGEVLLPKGYIRGPFGSALKKEFFVADGIAIYEQQHAIYDKRDFRYFIDKERAKSLKRFNVRPNDLIISCSGTIGKISIISEQDKIGVINQALLILRLNTSLISIKYLKQYLECYTHLIVSSTGGAITNIEKRSVIEKIQIPVPPLEEQERIVSILDKFDTLTASISESLPKEIELRKKQYEYYRDMLLTFPKDNLNS